MSRLIVKVGDFLIENIFMGDSIDKKQIKQNIKSNLEGIVLGLVIIVINFLVSLVPEIIPFSFDFEVFGYTLALVTLFNSFRALYYINKL